MIGDQRNFKHLVQTQFNEKIALWVCVLQNGLSTLLYEFSDVHVHFWKVFDNIQIYQYSLNLCLWVDIGKNVNKKVCGKGWLYAITTDIWMF